MHVGAFLFLIGGPFPGFVGAAGSYPVDIAIDRAGAPASSRHALQALARRSPRSCSSAHYTAVVWLVALLGWWARPVTGRMPEGLRNLGAVGLRYSAQVNAYLFLLTDRYPYSAPAVRDRPRDEQLELDLAADETGPLEA